MKMKHGGFLILAISLMFYGFVMPVHAQSPEDCESDQVWQGNACVDAVDAPDNDLNLKTDRVLYGQGSVVIVSGIIHNFANLSPSDVTIIVRAPDNNIVTVAQVHPAADGSFQTTFKTDGPQFKAPGDYTIFANFPGLTSEITFEFTGGTGGIISGGDSKPLTCPSGQTLVNGKCIVPEPKEPLTCPPGEELVNGKCIVPEPKEPLTCPPGEELVNGKCIVPEPKEPVCGPGTELVNGMCQVVKTDEKPGGGCLIATAAYGTELAPQVQFLREIRDNTVMSTSSGSVFMTGFNQLYYSFSPTIADMERENPLFQQAVRAFITPMISSLSIMTLAEDGSEAQVLGLGLSVIALNLGMYIAAPALIGFKIHRHFKTRN